MPASKQTTNRKIAYISLKECGLAPTQCSIDPDSSVLYARLVNAIMQQQSSRRARMLAWARLRLAQTNQSFAVLALRLAMN